MLKPSPEPHSTKAERRIYIPADVPRGGYSLLPVAARPRRVTCDL